MSLISKFQGLGAGGGKPSSIFMADISNGVLFSVFTVTAMAGGTIINAFGPRWTMMFGVTGYPIYVGQWQRLLSY
jgi:hypothetical protein